MIFRSLLTAALVAGSALAAPPLTTIQDVLYKADGTSFNGSLTISWTSFEAIDSSNIVTQSILVKVVDGNLRVQLVPTTSSTPAVYYSVIYNSDGRIQFKETWSVPSSAQPVRVRDVRMATDTSSADTGGTGTVGGDTAPTQESDIVGLIADLGARPLKGSAFGAGRVAMVNPLGALDAVSGNAGDCVRVDGSSGPCGAESQPAFVDGDSPSGIVDGANTVFSLSAVPDPASSLAVYRNGMLQKVTQDYTSSGRTIQFVAAAAPQPGDTLLASYRLTSTTDSTAPLPFPNPQVLCSASGVSTGSGTLSSMGTCAIPAGILTTGDRVEIHFDFEHVGTTSGFSAEVHWGGTTLLHRDAGASDTLVTGRADAAILADGAKLSAQTWGAVLPFSAGMASAADSYASGLTVDFLGKLAQGGTDTLVLRNFTVVRLP